jgi:hypothetical protein
LPGFKNFVTGNTLPETDLDDFLAAQVVMRYASAAARDADAVLTAAIREGMVAYLVDTDVLAYYNGTAWVEFFRGTAFSSSDPILNQSANVTYTKQRTGYIKWGRLVHYDFYLDATSAGTVGTDISIELPYATVANQVGGVIGTGFIYDASTTTLHTCELVATSTTFAKFLPQNNVAFSYLGNGVALTLASGDTVRGRATYESAT